MKSLAARKAFLVRFVGISLVLFLSSYNLFAYVPVLTHEEIVETCSARRNSPPLAQEIPRPHRTANQGAHAYAYGGAVIQTSAITRFGHVESVIWVHTSQWGFRDRDAQDSQDANEYALRWARVAHYASDITVTRGEPPVAIEYPKLRAKFGDSVRYAQDKTAHLRTEFGSIRPGGEEAVRHLRAITTSSGSISKPLLERSFRRLRRGLKDNPHSPKIWPWDLRWAVSGLIPQ